MKLVITTQVRENYGAHEWDGQGECPQRWKFKGGNTYVVRDLSQTQVDKIVEVGIPTITALLEERTDGYEEYLLAYDVVEDSAAEGEPWETPYSLYWEGGRWVARRTVDNGEYGYLRADISSKTEQYQMLMGGGRENYTVEYRDRAGDIMTLEVLTAAA
jgi:hypothetical protein